MALNDRPRWGIETQDLCRVSRDPSTKQGFLIDPYRGFCLRHVMRFATVCTRNIGLKNNFAQFMTHGLCRNMYTMILTARGPGLQ